MGDCSGSSFVRAILQRLLQAKNITSGRPIAERLKPRNGKRWNPFLRNGSSVSEGIMAEYAQVRSDNEMFVFKAEPLHRHYPEMLSTVCNQTDARLAFVWRANVLDYHICAALDCFKDIVDPSQDYPVLPSGARGDAKCFLRRQSGATIRARLDPATIVKSLESHLGRYDRAYATLLEKFPQRLIHRVTYEDLSLFAYCHGDAGIHHSAHAFHLILRSWEVDGITWEDIVEFLHTWVPRRGGGKPFLSPPPHHTKIWNYDEVRAAILRPGVPARVQALLRR